MPVRITLTAINATGQTATRNGLEQSWQVVLALNGDEIHTTVEIPVIAATTTDAETEARKKLKIFLNQANSAARTLRRN
jgi:hypothetical protein